MQPATARRTDSLSPRSDSSKETTYYSPKSSTSVDTLADMQPWNELANSMCIPISFDNKSFSVTHEITIEEKSEESIEEKKSEEIALKCSPNPENVSDFQTDSTVKAKKKGVMKRALSRIHHSVSHSRVFGKKQSTENNSEKSENKVKKTDKSESKKEEEKSLVISGETHEETTHVLSHPSNFPPIPSLVITPSVEDHSSIAPFSPSRKKSLTDKNSLQLPVDEAIPERRESFDEERP